MSREADLKWADECELAADRIDETGDYVAAIFDVWSVRRAQEVRAHLAYDFHADGGAMWDEPGADGAANALREWAADLRSHVALVDRMAAKRAAEATA